jgi:type III pantothenate kinase
MNAARGGEAVLVADVGNTRIKLACVAAGGRLPAVSRRQDLPSRDFHPLNLERWLAAAAPGPVALLVAAVNEAAAARLEAALAEISASGPRAVRKRRVDREHLPIRLQVEAPERVGIDRVCAAAAAAAERPGRPAVVVNCGTATTVDMVSAAGDFLGGAILPGPTLLARALAEGTSRLPEVAALDTAPPPPMPGRSTQQAIAVGIGWGMRGAVARLVAEARAGLGGEADVILTGGSAGVVRDALPAAILMPDLVLAGIALAADRALWPARDSG